MCDKAVNTHSSTIEYVPDQFKTQEKFDKIISDDPFKLKFCYLKYKSQDICNKAVDDFLPAVKFVPDWFVTSKVIKNLLTAIYADENILFKIYSGYRS